ncbi:methyl-accepting chemotaxis protein [Paeniroseomonas aquatica]|uniref:Methyl-accepting chemotaxis protein n=2 Tax=Paeniroseomonas aquatica TaxID=373043 RepID=A0ABT8A6E1_9PROT|nr:methyl-accepting chemotaxis protein [Paeniroseomonas aquatica]MDN3565357.1 methyl-accepting chemotaxis protein [Paeniroseomonas aquatica]
MSLPAVDLPQSVPAHPTSDALAGSVLDLLGRWLELSEIERRSFIAMTEELTASAGLIEQSTIDLSARFRDLATAADAQTDRVQRVAGLAKSIEVGGDWIPMAEATGFVRAALVQGIDALAAVAEQAGQMVAVLDGVGAEVAGAEECVVRIDTINKQARFVALNAAIEAQRAEGAGGTFKVIANELKELAMETDRTSRLVRQRINAVGRGLRGAHAQLQGIAGTDRSAQASTRARLEAVMAGMAAQNNQLATVLAEALTASGEMAGTVARLVTGAQFQDRTTQHLTHVSQAIEALGEATEALQCETRDAVPALANKTGVDVEMLQRMLSRQSLSSVRQRFLARLLDDRATVQEDDSAAGDVELF